MTFTVEPPRSKTRGLLKSDVTFVETLCSQSVCQEGSNVTILNSFFSLLFLFSCLPSDFFPSGLGLVGSSFFYLIDI